MSTFEKLKRPRMRKKSNALKNPKHCVKSRSRRNSKHCVKSRSRRNPKHCVKSRMRKKSNPLKKPKHRVKPKTYRKRPKNTKRKTAIYNPYNHEHSGNKLKINISIVAFLFFAYFIFSTAFVLRLNQPADKLLASGQMNTPDNMFNTPEINKILQLYNNLSKTKTPKSLNELNVKQIVTTDGETITPSATVNRDADTVFAEVDLQGGATGHLLQVADNLKMEQLSIFGIPAARGVVVMGEWSRVKGDIKIENFFKISDNSAGKDSRFSDTPNNPELFNLYSQVVIEQLSTMYGLNMLNSKQKDVGEFVIYLTELPALPIGSNPFSVSHAWHQDGNPISVQTDSGGDELSALNRRAKGYNCTECASSSIYDIMMTMTYANKEGRTAPWRHITDTIDKKTTITPIPSVTPGNTAIAQQSNDIQHGAYTSGSLADGSLATPRRALVVFMTENVKDWWKPADGLTRTEI